MYKRPPPYSLLPDLVSLLYLLRCLASSAGSAEDAQQPVLPLAPLYPIELPGAAPEQGGGSPGKVAA